MKKLAIVLFLGLSIYIFWNKFRHTTIATDNSLIKKKKNDSTSIAASPSPATSSASQKNITFEQTPFSNDVQKSKIALKALPLNEQLAKWFTRLKGGDSNDPLSIQKTLLAQFKYFPLYRVKLIQMREKDLIVLDFKNNADIVTALNSPGSKKYFFQNGMMFHTDQAALLNLAIDFCSLLVGGDSLSDQNSGTFYLETAPIVKDEKDLESILLKSSLLSSKNIRHVTEIECFRSRKHGKVEDFEFLELLYQFNIDGEYTARH